ncbi:hypothetical protein [Salinithrix halophila]|uniref:Uncharacterized protein n=1 Tax=Salinithrix halophila TaxID=1485204 RepID=A0ABV8JDG2_9BACL
MEEMIISVSSIVCEVLILAPVLLILFAGETLVFGLLYLRESINYRGGGLSGKHLWPVLPIPVLAGVGALAAPTEQGCRFMGIQPMTLLFFIALFMLTSFWSMLGFILLRARNGGKEKNF